MPDTYDDYCPLFYAAQAREIRYHDDDDCEQCIVAGMRDNLRAVAHRPWITDHDLDDAEGELWIWRDEIAWSPATNRWIDLEPGSWQLSGQRYGGHDEITGSWSQPLPAAQQYGLNCRAFCASHAWFMGDFLPAELVSDLYADLDEPF